MSEDLAHVRIVLVEPWESGNVGAAARAMKNFGFDDLTIVGRQKPLDEASVWWASGAEDLVSRARRFDDLSKALEGVHLAVATSSGRGREERPNRTPREVAAIHRAVPAHLTVAIVFGRERSGLTREELDLCAERATIPTSDAFPVMNLAQAVSLFCYELSAGAAAPVQERVEIGDDPATHDQLERVHDRFSEILREIGFLNQDNPEAVYRELRALLARARPSVREATVLLGIGRQLRWALDQRSASAGSGEASPRER